MTQTTEEKITLDLTRAEALVFFEWLAKHDGSLPIDDPAEQEVLWRIEGALERLLAEPLAPNYESSVAAARKRVREIAKLK